ncbi:MAG: 2,3-bisphosphoglycerate-independent phosphoglycerate mutase [Acidimicrobiales bacterium]|nr:2,3-bisphosphoglycerate-independent phosphoglycerate mutase [Acidimicrobiales bacterium]MCB9393602.1 2,3-bisphosphoglycerate-independent phosphoglycerate mutase [Acidimicrobiaceae bacterium]
MTHSPLSLARRDGFHGRSGPLLLVIADGVGIAPPGPSNAVTEADTPTLDALLASPLSTSLLAHGPAVGLPSDDDMGNSEVGHNALGAGRVFAQGAKLVNHALASGALYRNPVWQEAVAHGRAHTMHFLGLHSDGNVHSHIDHLHQMLERAAEEGVVRARVHVLLDGRDVPARSALDYLAQTEQVLQKINEHGADRGVDFRIASGGGRMTITMDRYGADWAMVQRGYECHTHGVGRPFRSAAEAVETMYAESDTGDQYLASFVVVDDAGVPVGTMHDGDAVVLYNFRGDRAIEISQAYEDPTFDRFDRDAVAPHPDVSFCGMLQYDGDALVPKRYLVDPPTIERTVSEYLCAEGVSTFAISETQKYGHVTYFWNGNKSGYIDPSLETYVEIPSDNVAFDTTPAMKVREITAATIEMLRSGRYRFGRLNFPSGDMVGHTGHLHATIDAMTVIDECMARLIEVIDELGGVLVYTADHGNADIMFTETADGVRMPKTSHTLSPVPFAIHDAAWHGEYHLAAPDGAGLANVAATLLDLLGFVPPSDYEPSVIAFDA